MSLKMRYSFFVVLVGLSLFSTGWYARGWYHGHTRCKASRRVGKAGFRFISPLLDVELPEGIDVRQEPIHFQKKIADLIQKQIAEKRVTDVSLYFRDLLDGPWFGINEHKHFDPASMMKVPVMIAWLKRAEKNPHVLDQEMVFRSSDDHNAMQVIKPGKAITPGQKYTVDQLLHFMINYSDNNATYLLYNAITPAEINDVLDNMDVENGVDNGKNSISVRGYSGFFRILYNAAYLDKEMSEKALKLLSLEDFPEGIAAGVPKGTQVAAKFGETDQQLHEFGIVYHPKGPYILGIMTRGNDLKLQAEVIREVSAAIYAEISASQ